MKKINNQHDTDVIIGKLLRLGVVISCAITVIGGIIYLFQHQGPFTGYKAVLGDNDIFEGAPLYLRELSTIIPQVFNFDGAAIIQIGVIALIATPILRVFFSLITYIIEKDKLYIVITLIVLAIIFVNMIFGLH